MSEERAPYEIGPLRGPQSDEQPAGPDWDALPPFLSTPQVARILTVVNGGKITSNNVRARVGDGEFGNVEKDERERLLIPRAAVREVWERIADKRNGRNTVLLLSKDGAHQGESGAMEERKTGGDAPALALMSRLQAQHDANIAALREQYEARLTDAQNDKAQLATLLREREDTTREIVSDYAQRLDETERRAREDVEKVRAEAAEAQRAKDAEIAELRQKHEGELAAQSLAQNKRNWLLRLLGQ